MRFFGQYLQNVDSKHRVVVPQALRDIIGEAELHNGLFLTRGFDDCLFLLPPSQWEEVAAQVSAGHFMVSNARRLERLFYGAAVRLFPDKLGRVIVPERLREMAGLEDEALFVGVANRIEVWSPARWGAVESKDDEAYEDLAEKVYRLLPGGEGV